MPQKGAHSHLLPEDAGPIPVGVLPDFVGILRVGQRGVTVERAAQISDQLGSEIATMTQALLAIADNQDRICRLYEMHYHETAPMPVNASWR